MRIKAIPKEPKWWQFWKRRQLKKEKEDAKIATKIVDWYFYTQMSRYIIRDGKLLLLPHRQHMETYEEYLKRVHKVTWDKRKKKWVNILD